MAKPSVVPRFAYDVTADVVPIPAMKAAIGWTSNATPERPPAQYANWLWNLNGEWCQYLNDFESLYAHVWTLHNSFNDGITCTRTTANNHAITATGNGTGFGLFARGGSSGVGAKGEGMGTTAAGLWGLGDLSGGAGGPGLFGQGGTNAAGGVCSGNGTGAGAILTGGLNGIGASISAGGGNQIGALCTGAGTGAGAQCTGGASSGIGGRFVGGAPNGKAVRAEGTGTGEGVDATASAGNALKAVSTGAADAIQATAGSGKAINATGAIHGSTDIKAANSLFAGRVASGASLPTPTVTTDEYTKGGLLFYCNYTWIGSPAVATLIKGRGVYAIDKVADGDAWITWQHTPVNLSEAQAMAGWAYSLNVAIDHAQIYDQDNAGTGGRLRYRVKTLDSTDTEATAFTQVFCIPD